MITADWPNYIFNVPREDLTLVQSSPTEIRECNINWLRLQIMALEDDPIGMTFPTVWTHYPEVDLGSLTLAKSIIMREPYTVTFEDGQYAVNLVGANSNVGDRVNVNQVSVRTANSAGMVSSPAIEYSSFNGGVLIDVVNGYSGTTYPTGTGLRPVNNIEDALLIANYRGFRRLFIKGSLNLLEYVDLTGFTIEGENALSTVLTLGPLPIIANARITDCYFNGYLDGACIVERCMVGLLYYVSGIIHECALDDNVKYLGGTDHALFLQCYGASDTNSLVPIDCNHSDTALTMRGFMGCIRVLNRTTPVTSCINFSGYCEIDSSCTTGNFDMSGNGDVVDNSTGTAFVDTTKLTHPDEIAEHVWSSLLSKYTTDGTAGKALSIASISNVDENALAAAVWDAAPTDFPIDEAAISAQVWANAPTDLGVDTDAIAMAVWDNAPEDLGVDTTAITAAVWAGAPASFPIDETAVSTQVWLDAPTYPTTEDISTAVWLDAPVEYPVNATTIAATVWSTTPSSFKVDISDQVWLDAPIVYPINETSVVTNMWAYSPESDGTALEKLAQAAIDSAVARKHNTNKVVISGDERTVTIYDDDNVTVLDEFDVSFDKKVRTPK